MELTKNQKEKVKVVFTGGHAGTTAIATIEEVVRQKLNWAIYWIGPKKTFEGKEIASYHSRVFPKLGVYYKGITTGRLQRKLSLWTIPSILKIPIGLIQAIFLMGKIRPKVVVSFGGYVAFPVCLSAWVFGIPVIIHEQTMAAGLANKLSSYFADKITLARKESELYYPKEKTILVGNPIRREILEVRPKKKISNSPTIYITGGSSGSQIINQTIDRVLEKILASYRVIHQAGELDISFFEDRKNRLPQNLKERYKVFSFIDPQEISQIYEKADILISRAGANTISEILATRRPSILIPIPWTRYDEQTKNALMAQNAGIAKVIKQEDLSGEKLLEELDEVKKDWEKMANGMDLGLAKLDFQAASQLVSLIKEILGSTLH